MKKNGEESSMPMDHLVQLVSGAAASGDGEQLYCAFNGAVMALQDNKLRAKISFSPAAANSDVKAAPVSAESMPKLKTTKRRLAIFFMCFRKK